MVSVTDLVIRLRRVILPFWRRAPFTVRRWLIWLGTSKFLVGVSAVCLNPQGQMLVLHHLFHNEHPWGFPGGWVDRGETPLQAIQREIREETGLEPLVDGILHIAGDGTWVDIIYLVRLGGDEPTIQPGEAREYRWVDPSRPGLNLQPAQARAAELAAGVLADRVTLPPP